MTQTPQEWLEEFFLKPNRPSKRADRSALYKYRTSNTEFAALKRVLKAHNGHRLWNKLFVLYAAEWWQQNFNGGHWAWQPIFDSLDLYDITIPQRNKIIEDGLEGWKRPVYQVNNRREFLATIVIEGGLPIQTVANNNGWLSKLLCSSFYIYYKQKHRYQDVLSALIRDCADTSSAVSMPLALQKDEVYCLLADIIEGLAYLKDTYPLTDKKSPVEFLNAQDRDWREIFPLPIDSDAGLAFIDNLLSDVANISSEPPPKYPFHVRRFLQQKTDGWTLLAEVKLPEIALIQHLNVPEADLPSRMRVSLETSSGVKKRFAHAYPTSQSNKSVLSISGDPLFLTEENAVDGMRLCLYNKEECIDDLPITKGEVLEDDLPWVFAQSGGEWNYVGQASQTVCADTALVVVKGDLHPSDGTFEHIGQVLGGRIYKIRGTVVFENKGVFENQGEKFRIKTGAKDVDGDEYVLEGTHAPFLSKPSWVCLGRPRLRLRDTETYSPRPMKGVLEAKPTGRTAQWEGLNDTHQGLISLRFKDSDDYIVFRKNIAILPRDFNISLRAHGTAPNRGDIIVKKAEGFTADITDKAIQCNPTSSNEQITLTLHSKEALPPERVYLHLSNTPAQDIIFTLPFPANGIRVFDANNRPLSEKSVLFLHDLYGIRFHLFNGQDGIIGRYQMRMKLHDDSLPNTRDICFDEREACGQKYLEIALIDYRDKITELFSISDKMDATVSVAVSLAGQEVVLNIHQYPAEMKQATQSGCVSLEGTKAHDDLENTVVLAALISNPDPPVFLEPLTSGGAHRAVWDFSPETRKDGHWIIYPDEKSAVQFRPLDWQVGKTGTFEHATTLQKAVNIHNDAKRMAAIKQLITLMAKDFTHPSWGYIDALRQNMGHLPLPVFDIWRAFADNPHGLVALLFHRNAVLLDKMVEEFPIMWELIPIDVWQTVFCCYYDYIKNNAPASLIDSVIEGKLGYIGAMLGMKNLAQTLRCLTGVDAQKQTVFPAQIVQKILKPEYQGGNGHSGLLNRRRDDTVPPFLRKDIEKRFFALPTEIRTLIPDIQPEQDAKKSVIYLPIILADESVRGNKNPYDLTHIFKMKILRSFDLDWFYFVFNMAQQYWHHHQHLERKK